MLKFKGQAKPIKISCAELIRRCGLPVCRAHQKMAMLVWQNQEEHFSSAKLIRK